MTFLYPSQALPHGVMVISNFWEKRVSDNESFATTVFHLQFKVSICSFVQAELGTLTASSIFLQDNHLPELNTVNGAFRVRYSYPLQLSAHSQHVTVKLQ
jgi:hypothetical protein